MKMSWRERFITSTANDWPIDSGGGEVDWSIRAVGEFRMAAQGWHLSETRETALSRSRAYR